MNKKNIVKRVKKVSVFKKFAPYMGNKSIFIPMSVILSAISAILSIFPYYYIWLISREIFIDSHAISTVNIRYYALMVFVFAVVGLFSYFVALMTAHFAAFEIETGIKKVGFEKVMHMPLGFFNINTSGKIRKIINDGAAETHVFLAHQLPDMAISIVTPILIMLIFFYFDWRLGLAALLPIILSFATMSRIMTEEGKAFQNAYTNALEEMNSEAVEYVRAIPVVKTFGQSIKSFTRFYNSIENYKNLVVAATKTWAKPSSLYLVFIESIALFLIPASILIINSGGNIGIVISNFILYILVAPQLSLVMTKSIFYKQQKYVAEQAIDRFNMLFDYTKMDYPEYTAELKGQTIAFKNVGFSYDGENNVLSNISFKVNKGETLALIGASGSGKTTIARLAARFWDVNSGEILIGDKNIKDYSKEELMENISFVFQNSQLFKRTLYENICFGRMGSNKE